MSKVVATFLVQNPLLSRYVRMGLVNITSLAHLIKKSNPTLDESISATSIAMAIRRHFAKLPKHEDTLSLFSKTPLQLVVRSNITELIFTKNDRNKSLSRTIFQNISDTNHFSCFVEGEKELVLITDNLDKLFEKDVLQQTAHTQTKNLGFVSVNLPISLREVVGVYSLITSTLAVAQIPIHSFHTLGGEILILVKNEDLTKTQEVLMSALVETNERE